VCMCGVCVYVVFVCGVVCVFVCVVCVLATKCITGESKFIFRDGRDHFLCRSIQTGYGGPTASYRVGRARSVPGGQLAEV